MRKVVFGALLCMLLACLTACGQKAPTWQEQYDLGVRYLSEGNYEEAVIAFTAAIEIAPKQEIIYEQLARAYIEIDDYESAISVLEQGYAATHSNHLHQLMEEYQELFESSTQESTDQESTNEFLTADWIRAEEWTINGVPLWEVSRADIDAVDSSMTGWQDTDYGYATKNGENISFEWNYETDSLITVSIDSWISGSNSVRTIQESRGINTESKFEDILRAVGLSEDGIRYINENLPSMEYNVILPVPITAKEEDYLFEVNVFRSDGDSTGQPGDSKNIFLEYQFNDGKRVSLQFHFYVDSDQFDYCRLNVY